MISLFGQENDKFTILQKYIFCILLLVIYMLAVADLLPRLGKRELIYLLLFTCNYVVSVQRGFLFLWVLVMGCVILSWHSLCLSYKYLSNFNNTKSETNEFACFLLRYRPIKAHIW